MDLLTNTPDDFPLPQSIVSPFSKKRISWQIDEQTFLAKLMGGCCSTWGINDLIMLGARKFQSTFGYSKNCKSENVYTSENIFMYMKNIYLKIKPGAFHVIMEGFILEVNGWEVSKVMSWSTWLWHITLKVNSTVESEKTSFAHYPSRVGNFMQSLAFFKTFCADLYFDALNLELFQICLVMRQSFEKSTLYKGVCFTLILAVSHVLYLLTYGKLRASLNVCFT